MRNSSVNITPLGDIFCKVANPFKIVGNAQGSHDLPQIDGHRLPPSNRGYGFLLNLPLQLIDPVIRCDDPFGARRISLDQSSDRISDLLAVEATHLSNFARKLLQVVSKARIV